MFVIQELETVPDRFRNAIVAIGNFDGVHKGHATLLKEAKEHANSEGKPLVVLTFEPHPRALFQPDGPPFRITPPPVKRRCLELHGVDAVVEILFDWGFASRSPENFMSSVLREKLGAEKLYVGHDFRFGQLRKGDTETLRAAGFDVCVLKAVADEADAIYSSSRIREFIRSGDMAHAAEDLGWMWEIEGVVVQGDQRGRTLGYPTANIMLKETIHPAYGIYAAWVQIVDEERGENLSTWRMGATNIGIRPMFKVPVGQVEVHILDFDEEIYGRTLRLRPVRLLRGEARFETIEALVARIGLDCALTREILEKNPLLP